MGVRAVFPHYGIPRGRQVPANRLAGLRINECMGDGPLHLLCGQTLACWKGFLPFSPSGLVGTTRSSRGLIPRLIASVLVRTQVKQWCPPRLGVGPRSVWRSVLLLCSSCLATPRAPLFKCLVVQLLVDNLDMARCCRGSITRW